MRSRLGAWMRKCADRIDPPKITHDHGLHIAGDAADVLAMVCAFQQVAVGDAWLRMV